VGTIGNSSRSTINCSLKSYRGIVRHLETNTMMRAYQFGYEISVFILQNRNSMMPLPGNGSILAYRQSPAPSIHNQSAEFVSCRVDFFAGCVRFNAVLSTTVTSPPGRPAAAEMRKQTSTRTTASPRSMLSGSCRRRPGESSYRMFPSAPTGYQTHLSKIRPKTISIKSLHVVPLETLTRQSPTPRQYPGNRTDICISLKRCSREMRS
jgi:hypothetical protein